MAEDIEGWRELRRGRLSAASPGSCPDGGQPAPARVARLTSSLSGKPQGSVAINHLVAELARLVHERPPLSACRRGGCHAVRHSAHEAGCAKPSERATRMAARSSRRGESWGTYTWPANGATFPRIQVITVDQLLQGDRAKTPPLLLPYIVAFKAGGKAWIQDAMLGTQTNEQPFRAKA